jgi:ribokinase
VSVGVAVVGSANLDVVVSVDRFPSPGETVLGQRLEQVPGGKGLNQAVAAARHSPAAFVGCIGTDEAGEMLLDHLLSKGVDVRHVARVQEPTGRAFIQVTPDGENAVVVMTLANHRLTPKAVRGALEALRPTVVLAQLEIPIGAVEEATAWATASGSRFLLNASPMRDLPPKLLRACDPLVVNAGEARALLGDASDEAPPSGCADIADLAGRLTERVPSAAVTAGADGVTVARNPDDTVHVAGVPVTAVDTTGAGDEFAGALAAALAGGASLEEAARQANQAAARLAALPRTER